MAKKKKTEQKTPMKNITINIPHLYDKNIQWLIKNKITSSRSECIRTALREFLHKEYSENLKLLGFPEGPDEKSVKTSLPTRNHKSNIKIKTYSEE